MKNNNIEDTLGKRIKAARIRKGYTQEQLAEVMCVTKATLSAYENDKVDIKGSVLIELSGHLDTSPNYLLGFEDGSEDSFIKKAETLLLHIKDKRAQEMLLAQLTAISNM